MKIKTENRLLWSVLLLTLLSIGSANTVACLRASAALFEEYEKLNDLINRQLYNQTLEELPVFLEKAESFLQNCDEPHLAQMVEHVIPLKCAQTLPQTIKLLYSFTQLPLKARVQQLPAFMVSFTKSQSQCPLIDRQVHNLIPNKNVDLVNCVDSATQLWQKIVDLEQSIQHKGKFDDINDDILEVANDIEEYLKECDFQKFEYEYIEWMPLKCRNDLHRLAEVLIQIGSKGNDWKTDLILISKLQIVLVNAVGSCPMIQ